MTEKERKRWFEELRFYLDNYHKVTEPMKVEFDFEIQALIEKLKEK